MNKKQSFFEEALHLIKRGANIEGGEGEKQKLARRAFSSNNLMVVIIYQSLLFLPISN
ncbi:MAG: hypothetical protein ACTSYR_00805 [Candidatus Odinarchaeia archaeon]